MKRHLILLILSLLLPCLAIQAQQAGTVCDDNHCGLQLPPYYTDNMVLPRNRPFTLRGTAHAADRISVTLSDEATGKPLHRLTARTRPDGTWSVEIPALSEHITYTLTVKDKSARGGKPITLSGILAGELWLASGQSNMAFQLQHCTTATEDIANARHPRIRLLDIRPRWDTNATVWSPEALDSVNRLLYYHDATWQPCTPETVRPFSAIAYHFARILEDSLQCPVGIICNAVGGSGEEAWIDHATLARDLPEILHDWTRNELIQDWVRGRAQLNMGWQQQGAAHNPGQRHPYEPFYLYDASIRLLRDMPIAGVIWYQGESNAQDMATHTRLFPLLLKSWRETWDTPTLPFIYTQLSSLNRPTWPEFRDLQRRQLTLDPDLGMAVTSDVGDSLDVHPRHKRPVGDRLARWALYKVYHHACVCSGPLFRSLTMEGDHAIIRLDFGEGLRTSDGGPLRTLEVSADGDSWQSATAHADGDRLIIDTPDAGRIRHVRYGWQPFTRANLVNAAGLPASTFKGECKE